MLEDIGIDGPSLVAFLINAFLLIIFFPVYFIPSIVAFVRDQKNKLSILLFNLFLGWLFIPWIIALVWATKSKS